MTGADTPAQQHPSLLRLAAWVPDDDPERPWDDAADLAAEWIWERSRSEGVQPMVVTNTFSVHLPVSLATIADQGWATPQGKGRYDRGPVVVFVPDERTLRKAMDLARGHSLVAIEGYGFSLAQWAAGVDAINLVDPSQRSDPLPTAVIKDLDSVVFFGGRNGWTGRHEQDHARSHLADHVRSGRLQPDQAAAYVMSQGVSDRGAKRLRTLLDRIG